MHELIEIARQNEELTKRIHQLALTLMDAAEPKEIFLTLYDDLKHNFRANRVAMQLFADPVFIDSYTNEEFVEKDIKEESLFSVHYRKTHANQLAFKAPIASLPF